MVADNIHSGKLPSLVTGWFGFGLNWCAVELWFQSKLVLAALGEAFSWA